MFIFNYLKVGVVLEKVNSQLYLSKYNEEFGKTEIFKKYNIYKTELENLIKNEERLWKGTSYFLVGYVITLTTLLTLQLTVFEKNSTIPLILLLITVFSCIVSLFFLSSSIKIKFYKQFYKKFIKDNAYKNMYVELYKEIQPQLEARVKIPSGKIKVEISSLGEKSFDTSKLVSMYMLHHYSEYKISIVEDVLLPLNIFKLYNEHKLFTRHLWNFCKDIVSTTEHVLENQDKLNTYLNKYFGEEVRIISIDDVTYVSDKEKLPFFIKDITKENSFLINIDS